MYNNVMVNLTREDVHRLAMLSKITIAEDEIAQMDAQIKADNDAGENDDSGDGFYDSNDNGENK